MNFRRCKVAKAGSASMQSTSRYAWVPVDRAYAGSGVSLSFPGERPDLDDVADFAVLECDSLVVDGSVLAYCHDEPMGGANQ